MKKKQNKQTKKPSHRTDSVNEGNKNIKLNTLKASIFEFDKNLYVKNCVHFFPRIISISLLLLPKTLFSF